MAERPNTEGSPLLREHEAAEYLNVSTKTLQNWRSRGVPPRYRKLNGAVRYVLADLLAFVDGEKA